MNLGPRRLLGGGPEHRRRIWLLVRPHRRRVFSLGIVSFLGGSCEALFLVLCTRVALAVTLREQSLGAWGGIAITLGRAIAAAAVLLVLRLLLNAATVWLSTGLAQEILTRLRRQLSEAYLGASWAVQQADPSGTLQALNGFATASVRIVNAFTGTISTTLSLLSMLLVSTAVNPLFTVIAVATLAVLGRLMAPLRHRIRARAKVAAAASAAYDSTVAELASLGLEMQTFGVRQPFTQRLDQQSRRHAAAARRTDLVQGMLTPAYTTLAYGGVVLGLALFASTGTDDIAGVGAVMLLLLRSLAYGQQLQMNSGTLMVYLPSLERVDNALARYVDGRATDGGTVLEGLGSIEAHDVSFSYPNGRDVLSGLSFAIAPGEIIGVIGPSGAGKSTLVQLLLGVREPTDGAITVGGTALEDIDRGSWTARVAFVAQDANLFTGTVAENLRFFRDAIGDDALLDALARSNLAGEVTQLPEGIDTFLGERGAHLSGGQRQRLSIARALAGGPELLVLDEPTSALDAGSEANIRATLGALRGRVTTIVIAHRLSTLDICDRIMVIEHGRLSAFAPPDELARCNAFYRHALDVSGLNG